MQARQRTLHRRFGSTSRAWGKVDSNPCITSQDKVDHQTQTTIPKTNFDNGKNIFKRS